MANSNAGPCWLSSAVWFILVPSVLLVLEVRVSADDTRPASTISEVQEGQTGLGSSSVPGSTVPLGLAQASVEPATGTLNTTISFQLLQARGSVQPALALTYSSANGIGYGGYGWTLNLPSIERHNLSGSPLFKDPENGTGVGPETDSFTFSGQALVPICHAIVFSESSFPCHGESLPIWADGWHYYRLENDNDDMPRFFWSPDHTRWIVQLKSGETEEFGIPSDDLNDEGGVDHFGWLGKIYRWNLVRQHDGQRLPSGRPSNLIIYKWEHLPKTRGTPRGYLVDIFDTPLVIDGAPQLAWFAHHAHLRYKIGRATLEPDKFVTQIWKAVPDYELTDVDITSKDFQLKEPLSVPRAQVRRYHLSYYIPRDFAAQIELLASVQLEGRCDSRNPIESPDTWLLPDRTTCQRRPGTSFIYSEAPSSPRVVAMPPVRSQFLPLLFDINSDGLVDVVTTPGDPRGPSQIVSLNSIGTVSNEWTDALIGFTSNDLDARAGTFRPGLITFASGAFQMDAHLNVLWMKLRETDGPWRDVKDQYALFSPSFIGNQWMWKGQLAGTFGLSGCPWYPFSWAGNKPELYNGCELPYAPLDIDGDGLTDLITTTAWVHNEETENKNDVRDVNRIDLSARFTKRNMDGIVWPFGGAKVPLLCVGNTTTEDHFKNEHQLLDSDNPITFADMNGDGLIDLVRFGPSSR